MQVFQHQALARQVQGHALAGDGAVGRTILRMQATYPYAPPGGAEQQFVSQRYRPGEGGAGDHHASTLDAEGAIDGQTKIALNAAHIMSRRERQQAFAQGCDTLPPRLSTASKSAPASGPGASKTST